MASNHDEIFCLNARTPMITKFNIENFEFILEVMPLLFFSCIFLNHIQGIQKQGIINLWKIKLLLIQRHLDA